METEKMMAVLEEIREFQRQHLEEYRRVANEALALQKQAFELQQSAVAQQKVAVDAQANHLRLFRRVLIVAAPVVAYLIWLIATIL